MDKKAAVTAENLARLYELRTLFERVAKGTAQIAIKTKEQMRYLDTTHSDFGIAGETFLKDVIGVAGLDSLNSFIAELEKHKL